MHAALKKQLHELWMRGAAQLIYLAVACIAAAGVVWVVLGLWMTADVEANGAAQRLNRLLELVRFYSALLFLAAAVFYLGKYAQRRRLTAERLDLLEKGRPVMGRITAKGPGLEIEYSFSDDRGRNHYGRMEIARRWIDRYEVGHNLLIVMDPLQPTRHVADLFGFRADDFAKLSGRRA
ncbi:MAG: hypothetical protein NZM00_08205 [Anaerolinea sp.]|nr:hypothetical protein [Anaerolinea sp.]